MLERPRSSRHSSLVISLLIIMGSCSPVCPPKALRLCCPHLFFARRATIAQCRGRRSDVIQITRGSFVEKERRTLGYVRGAEAAGGVDGGAGGAGGASRREQARRMRRYCQPTGSGCSKKISPARGFA